VHDWERGEGNDPTLGVQFWVTGQKRWGNIKELIDKMVGCDIKEQSHQVGSEKGSPRMKESNKFFNTQCHEYEKLQRHLEVHISLANSPTRNPRHWKNHVSH